jgi:hypothetical protein
VQSRSQYTNQRGSSRYSGYSECCHEDEDEAAQNSWQRCAGLNRWEPCPCAEKTYLRRENGVPYCESCLDDVPPNHEPIFTIVEGFAKLRKNMDKARVKKGVAIRFSREYKRDLKKIKDRAKTDGVDSNYYNEVRDLFREYKQRARDVIEDARAGR